MTYFEKQTPIIADLGFRTDRLSVLKAYISHLWQANEELNLISRKMSYEELIDNHVIDCLLPLKEFPQKVKKVADLGSGGGLPSVIYAIQFPDVEFHLFEKSPNKQNFLTSCQKFAPNLYVHGDLPKQLNQIDLVTARAFKPIDVILELTRDYYKNDGKYFLLKARKDKIEEELSDARKKFKDLKAELIPLHSPVLEVERHLVII